MGAPRQPGRTQRRGEHGSIAVDYLGVGPRYRARYRDHYVGSYRTVDEARKAIDAMAAQDTLGPKKKQGRKPHENGVIHSYLCADMSRRYRARYMSKYLGSFDTIKEAQAAIDEWKGRRIPKEEESPEGSLEKSGTSGASPHEKA
jgi:hypothetical protein